jgi:large subunit ribosomal protein L30
MEKEKIKKTQIKNNIEKNVKLLAVIRISGKVNIKSDMEESLYRLRLRKKYTCALIDSSKKDIMGVLKKVKNNVAYGEINKETLSKLIKARGKSLVPQDFNSDKIAEDLISGKSLSEIGFKPFFRLHPPRGGINTKLHYPKGVLGNHKENINKLIERML